MALIFVSFCVRPVIAFCLDPRTRPCPPCLLNFVVAVVVALSLAFLSFFPDFKKRKTHTIIVRMCFPSASVISAPRIELRLLVSFPCLQLDKARREASLCLVLYFFNASFVIFSPLSSLLILPLASPSVSHCQLVNFFVFRIEAAGDDNGKQRRKPAIATYTRFQFFPNKEETQKRVRLIFPACSRCTDVRGRHLNVNTLAIRSPPCNA